MEAELKKNPELEDNEKFMAGLKAARAFAAVAGGAAGALDQDGKRGPFEEGKKEDDTNESVDIDALIAEIESELEEGKDEEDVKEAKDDELEEAKKKVKKTEDELEEALATVDTLKESISEMNLLNSKLFY